MSEYGEPLVYNNIIYGNEALTNSDDPCGNMGQLGHQVWYHSAEGDPQRTTFGFNDIEDYPFGIQSTMMAPPFTPGPGNIDEPPLFVDESGGNLRLSCASLLIDAADETFLPSDTEDVNNNGETDQELAPDRDLKPRVFTWLRTEAGYSGYRGI